VENELEQTFDVLCCGSSGTSGFFVSIRDLFALRKAFTDLATKAGNHLRIYTTIKISGKEGVEFPNISSAYGSQPAKHYAQ
jgi:hypothetical protein